MNQRRKWILALCLTLTQLVMAQTNGHTVKGTVVDGTSEPLVGVTVQVVGKQGYGTVTDIDGNYSINVATNEQLKFSYIGYKDQVVSVA